MDDQGGTALEAEMAPWVFEWHDPDMFKARVEAVRGARSPSELLTHGSGPKHWQEAWIAATFLTKREARREFPSCEVRLVEQDPPDFQIRCEGITHDFEIVMASDPQRRLSADYEKGGRFSEKDAAVEVSQNALWPLEALREYIGPALQRAAKAKALKAYKRPVHLLVWLNTQASEVPLPDLLGTARVSLEGVRAAFDSVWMLAFGHAVNVFETAAPD